MKWFSKGSEKYSRKTQSLDDKTSPAGGFFKERLAEDGSSTCLCWATAFGGGDTKGHASYHIPPFRLATQGSQAPPKQAGGLPYRPCSSKHGIFQVPRVPARVTRTELRVPRGSVLGQALPGLGRLCPLRVVRGLCLFPCPARAGVAAGGSYPRARWVFLALPCSGGAYGFGSASALSVRFPRVCLTLSEDAPVRSQDPVPSEAGHYLARANRSQESLSFLSIPNLPRKNSLSESERGE